jgi:hypothetical protein
MSSSIDRDNRESGRPGIAHCVLIGVELFVAVGAVYGGVGLISGNAIHIADEWLAGTPFNSWVLPGILLLIVVALPMTVAAVAEIRRLSWSYRASPSRVARRAAGSPPNGLSCNGFPLQPAMFAARGAVLLLAWAAHGQAQSVENKAESWKK